MGGKRKTIQGFDFVLDRSDGGLGVHRIVSAPDYDLHRRREAMRLAYVIKQLDPIDRTFVQNVLAGKTWRELGVSRQLFSYHLKKIEKIISGL